MKAKTKKVVFEIQAEITEATGFTKERGFVVIAKDFKTAEAKGELKIQEYCKEMEDIDQARIASIKRAFYQLEIPTV